jgi:hypothetical protein
MDATIPQRGTIRWDYVLQARTGWARGWIRATIEAIQAECLTELHTLDAEIDRLVERREQVVADLRRCRDALGGVGNHQYRRVPLPDDVDAEPSGTRTISGADLRETLLDILRSAERPLSLRELNRCVLARGRSVRGRPSQTLANALRAAVERGNVRRVRRGVYKFAVS